MSKFRRACGAWSFLIVSISTSWAFGQAGQVGQVVQLPTLGNFSVNTSVSVPDSGAGFLGSNGQGQWGSVSRGGVPGTRGIGSRVTLPMASVHVQIHDLEALDQAILAAAQGESTIANMRRGSTASSKKADQNPKSALPMGSSQAAENQLARDRLSGAKRNSRTAAAGPNSNSSRSDALSPYPPKDDPSFGSTSNSTNSMRRSADYNYLAALSHPSLVESSDRTTDDVRFYLTRAQAARRNGQWASAQLFYEQAWGRLSESKQQAAIDHLNHVKNPESELDKSNQKGLTKTAR